MTSPTPICTTSPGTSAVTSIAVSLPSRMASAVWRSWEWSASTASSERYSLKNPSPMLRQMIARMIAASVPSPTKNDVSAAATSRIRSGFLSWRISTASGRAP